MILDEVYIALERLDEFISLCDDHTDEMLLETGRKLYTDRDFSCVYCLDYEKKSGCKYIPDQVFPEQDYPEQENPLQLNKDIQSTDRSNKDKSTDKKDKTRVRAIREQIKDNIEYDILVERYGADKLDALVELMLEAIISDHPYCIISKEKLPRDMVRSQLLKSDSSHIEFVLDELNETTSKVGNTRAYVLSALFNAPANMDNHYQFEVNHDYPMHRRRRKA